jgi:hypothetical protein
VTGVILRLAPIALRLPRVLVLGSTGCTSPGPPDSTPDSALAGIFTQLRENVERFRIVLDEYPFHYSRKDSLVLKTSTGKDSILSVDTTRYESRARRPYRVGHVLYTDTDSHGRRAEYMYLPTFRDLGDSTFLATHCWSYGGMVSSTSGHAGALLSIDFRPANDIHAPDVAGSIHLDSASLMVRRAIFVLTNPSMARPPLEGLSVTSTFRELVPLVPLIDSVITYQDLGIAAEAVRGTVGYRMVDRGAVIQVAHLLHYGFEREALGSTQPSEPAAPGPP